MQTILPRFGGFQKVFITHSFCKRPLYTVQSVESVKRNAELFLSILRLLSQKQRLNQNSSIAFVYKISVLKLISVV